MNATNKLEFTAEALTAIKRGHATYNFLQSHFAFSKQEAWALLETAFDCVEDGHTKPYDEPVGVGAIEFHSETGRPYTFRESPAFSELANQLTNTGGF